MKFISAILFNMKRKPAEPRIPLATAIKEEIYQRILKLRDKGFTVPDLLIMGIETAEKKK